MLSSEFELTDELVSFAMRPDYSRAKGKVREVLTKVKAWIVKERRKRPWLVLYGRKGTGKTTAAIRAALKIADREEILFIKQVRLEFYLEGLYEYERKDVLEDIANAPLVIVDDFGVGAETKRLMSYLYYLFDRRYVGRLPTIVTTNLDVEHFRGEASELRRSDHYFELIVDRMHELGYFVHFDFPSFRSGSSSGKDSFTGGIA